jgi:hypothetical protein
VRPVGINAAVFAREAVRSAHRGRTTALRVGFASLLLLLLGGTIAQIADDTTGQLAAVGQIGHSIFSLLSTVNVLLVPIVAAMLTAQSIIEEREDQTLDLVRLTGLSDRNVLLGKIGSRMMVVGSLVVAAVPAFVLVLQFGGVGPTELLAHGVGIAVSAAAGAALAFPVAAVAPSAVSPLGVVLLGMGVSFLVLPGLLADATTWRLELMAMLSPLVVTQANLGQIATFAVVWLPTIVGGWLYGLTVFRAEGSGADGTTGGPDRERHERWVGFASALAGGVLLALPAVDAVDQQCRAQGASEASRLLWSGWFAFANLAATLILSQLGVRAVLRAESSGLPRAGSAMAAVRQASLGWRLDPVVWRELATRGSGIRGTAIVASLAWLLLIGLFTANGRTSARSMAELGTLGLALTVAVAVIHANQLIVDERSRRTLAVFFAGVYPARRWIAMKTRVVHASVGWIALTAVALVGLGNYAGASSDLGLGLDHRHGAWGRSLGPESAPASAVVAGLSLLWVFAVVHGASGVMALAAARIRPIASTWPVAFAGWGAAIVGGSLVDDAVFRYDGPAQAGTVAGPAVGIALAELAIPLWSPAYRCSTGGVPPGLIASVLAWGLLGAAARWLLARRLPAWAEGDPR